jgi:hypothetical protein
LTFGQTQYDKLDIYQTESSKYSISEKVKTSPLQGSIDSLKGESPTQYKTADLAKALQKPRLS